MFARINSCLFGCLARIFAKAPFVYSAHTLRKFLRLSQLIFLGLSCTIGSGSYSVLGYAAQKSGPSLAISCVITGVVSFFTCFSYAEFAAKIPSAGFAYSYVYSACGELLGYLVGHSVHLNLIATSALAARCWASYVAGLLSIAGVHIPLWMYSLDLGAVNINILGAGLVLVFCALMLMGVKESTRVNNIVSALNMSTLIFVVLAGWWYTKSEYYKDFFPFGAKGVFSGMGLVFFSYMGFESLACFTEEAVNPQRDIPISLAAVLAIAIAINAGISLVMTGLAPLSVMNVDDSLVAVFRHSAPFFMTLIIYAGAITGLTASVSGNIMSQPRIFYSMACDGLLPDAFRRIKGNVLQFSVVASCALAAAVALLVRVELIGNAVSLAGIMCSVMVNLAVIVSRYCGDDGKSSMKVNLSCTGFFVFALVMSFGIYYGWPVWSTAGLFAGMVAEWLVIQFQVQRNLPKTFKCPCVPLVPLLGAFSLIFIAATIDAQAWIVYLIYTGIGVASYFAYGYWHSLIGWLPKVIIPNLEEITIDPCQDQYSEQHNTKEVRHGESQDIVLYCG